MVLPPLTAQATERPCELHKNHSPVVVRTQGHHIFPQYLQIKVYGKVLHEELLWLCGTDHDSLHAWLSYALGESYKPEQPVGYATQAQVERVLEWYRSAT